MREYAVDPLEALFARDALQAEARLLRPDAGVAEVRDALLREQPARRQRLYPVVDEGHLLGVVGWTHLVGAEDEATVGEVAERDPVVAYADEILRTVATRMAAHHVGAVPVLDRASGTVVGVLTEFELLAGRRRQLVEERTRERPLRLPRLVSRARAGRVTA
jgi:Mg/Co/Ni transporter MgtE